MVNGYDNNSPKYSRGYADPENMRYNQNANYQTPNRGGFADSLENQFYFDRPAKKEITNNYDEKQRAYNDNAPRNARQNDYSDHNAYADSRQKAEADYDADPTYYDYNEMERQQNLSTRYQKPARSSTEYQKEQMSYTTDDDTAPTPTTMQYSSIEAGDNPFEDYHKKGESVDKQYTINTKGKILIAVYALVVATVFALIILNTRLLKTMNASMIAKEMRITTLSMEVDNLQKEYEYVSSDEVIEKKAEEKGMVKA